MYKLLSLLFSLVAITCSAQVNSPAAKFMDVTPMGYAQYVEIDLGSYRMLIISGQVAIDEQGTTIGKGDLPRQIEECFIKVKNIVERAGGSMSNIVKLTNYLTDISQIQSFRKIRDKFINSKNPPASTSVQVTRLFKEDILVEIEATVIIPK